MTDVCERFQLPDGLFVGTGLLPETQESGLLSASYPVYGEEFYHEPKDIEKLLKGDVYQTFRRIRSPYVISQGGVGQCASASPTSAMHNIRMSEGLPHVALNGNYIYTQVNGGRDNGSLLVNNFTEFKKGIPPRVLTVDGKEVVYPHTAFRRRDVSPALLQAADKARVAYQSFEAYRLPSENYNTFRIALASALANDHQVLMAWHVVNASMNLRNGYVVCGNGPGNHASLFHSAKWVGGADIVHPDLQNTWGPSKNARLYGPTGYSWGQDGFGLMTMTDSYKCARNHVFWVLPGTRIRRVTK